MKLKKIISEWNDQSFKGLSKRWGKPYNQEGTDFENNTGGNKTLSEGPMNDPALKSLRIKSKGELMPELSKWWEYDPDDVMRFVYWGKGQLPPHDEKVREKEWANIVQQLHVKYPIPADAKGMADPPEGFIGESKTMKLKNLLNKKQINEVDYSTMKLKSNIDQKWDSAKTMQNDLSQWIESTYAATGNVGDILKALEQVLTRTKNVSKEAPSQVPSFSDFKKGDRKGIYSPGDYKIGKKF
jgi:hypothetical protein